MPVEFSSRQRRQVQASTGAASISPPQAQQQQQQQHRPSRQQWLSLSAPSSSPQRRGLQSGRSPGMTGFFNGLLYGLGGLASVCLILLVAFQEKLVYVPVLPGLTREYPIFPSRFRLQYEDVWLRAKDGVKLHSWFIKFDPPIRGPTILFFQENAGNIAHRLEFIDIMMQYLRCNVFMLSYRGYGASDGSPSQWGLTQDAQAALEHLLARDDIDQKRIAVFGRSLGGAVAVQLVKNNPGKVSVVILENTFTSILEMAGIMMPFLKHVIGHRWKPLNFLVRSQWRSLDAIEQIREPILFISGLKDEMIPPTHMKKLYEAAKSARPRLMVEFSTGMHMDTWIHGKDAYWRAISNFLNQYASGADDRDTM